MSFFGGFSLLEKGHQRIPTTQESMSIQDQNTPLARMAHGFARFQQRWYYAPDSPYATLREKQSPSAMVVACSDSRVDPSLLLDAEPGQLFVVRNVGNLVPPYEPDGQHHGVSAALEFAVRVLQVPDIFIMGHARCGGFDSLLRPERYQNAEFVNIWMDLASEARAKVDASMPDAAPSARCDACAMQGIRLSLRNLMTFPWVAERVTSGLLHLHGLYFDLETGGLLRFDPPSQTFAPLVEAARVVWIDS